MTTGYLPRGGVREAVKFHSGGAFTPGRSPGWEKLDKRLREAGFSGREFCYFMLYVEGFDREIVKLQKTNLMACDRVWHEFLVFKAGRQDEVGKLVKAQNAQVKIYEKVYTLKQVLDNRLCDLNSVVTAESALRMYKQCGEDPWPILNKCGVEAGGMILGSPEYLIYCPRLLAGVKQRDFLYDAIFPAVPA